MDGYISKPINSEQLFKTIGEVLANLNEHGKMLQS